ncbi:hypothetical protein [Streptomyces griseoflavus]|uniref:Uncharacterized protein n=1 Tax=Streptomyces griseoflavus Tu4000 TaxID=467200 RepID=D9Y294_9ACTN|nr:hypothetical protein [Streptomyces griseoflavus]EFL37258.1 conserved hypothetical protein [Streptomyces griseoflavus Tu4000]
MQGNGAGEEVAAARARNLQPEDGWPDARRLLGAPVTSQDLRAMNGRQTKEARRQQASIDRRLANGRLVTMLEQDGFQGPLYDRFVEELVRYGISVLRGWMHSGYIFELVAQRGFGLSPHELDLEDLATDSDLREGLATMTIARALPRFRQQALVARDGLPRAEQASLPTSWGRVRTTSPMSSAGTGPAKPGSTAPCAERRSSTARPSARSALPRKSWAT